VRGQGIGTFVDELTRFAAGIADVHDAARVSAIAARAGAPLQVAVRGRSGVGCRTVGRALDDCGVALAWDDPKQADLVVHVLAEVVKPEDSMAISEERRPVLVVLNKSDLLGFAGDGPVAVAKARCGQFSALLGAPVRPMSALLAVGAHHDVGGRADETLWIALRVLAGHPYGPASVEGSHEGFLAATVPVPAGIRQRLLETFDLFGIALAVAAFRQGSSVAQARRLLRRVSGVDAVVSGLTAAGAGLRYRRVLDAVAELEALAVSGGDTGSRIGEFLRRDDTVVARMAAALDATDAGPADGHDAARDIARGSLRLASQPRTGAQQ
jgi:hypothetical protein